jgi:hypothetical protein
MVSQGVDIFRSVSSYLLCPFLLDHDISLWGVAFRIICAVVSCSDNLLMLVFLSTFGTLIMVFSCNFILAHKLVQLDIRFTMQVPCLVLALYKVGCSSRLHLAVDTRVHSNRVIAGRPAISCISKWSSTMWHSFILLLVNFLAFWRAILHEKVR